MHCGHLQKRKLLLGRLFLLHENQTMTQTIFEGVTKGRREHSNTQKPPFCKGGSAKALYDIRET